MSALRRFWWTVRHGSKNVLGEPWFPDRQWYDLLGGFLVAVGQAAVLVGVIFTAWVVVYLLGG